ncbi:MAG: NAD(P)-dependent oxidoreductase [Bacteroidaceae bacterium]|nr:NAD(P)-dependent oxidoreductase [Bacteroidaceae bacterium]
MTILITGATGFIGSFICEEAVKRGFNTFAAIRKTSSLKYISDERIHKIELNLGSKEQLVEALGKQQFDYVVHAAGATKCIDKADFFRINTDGTKNLIDAVRETQPQLKRFVFISSLSIFGAIREQQPYEPIKEQDTPQPNTAYGESKLLAEQYLRQQEGFPYVILRPTGVYGPREKDYLMMFDSIRKHIDFAVGYKPQVITFIYVTDVVQAVFLALEKDVVGRAYFLSDGKNYSSTDFSDLIIKELNAKCVLRLKAPLAVLKLITTVGDYYGRMTHRMTVLNRDKYNILSQRNWMCDITPACKELGYMPTVLLPEGVRLTAQSLH